MRLHFRPASRGNRALCDVDVYFNADTPFAALRLTGFTIWKSMSDGYTVTLPSRLQTGPKNGVAAGGGKYYDLVRAADVSGSPEAYGAVRALKEWVLEEWTAQGRPGAERLEKEEPE